jgi:hypothetical protein
MISNDEWVSFLTPLVERDLFIREALERRGILEDTYHPEMERVHKENALALMIHFKTHGFPVLSNAGEKAVQLSWMIIQHAVSFPDFQRECLIQMRLAAAEDDYPKDLLAYTDDRIAFFEGRSQLYGTNFDWEDGELRPTTIEDPQYLDQRRQAYGLPPMAETLFKIVHTKPPKDIAKKTEEFEIWLKSVGWRS